MSKYVASIPLGDIERVQIYINKSVKTLAEIKAETGADYLINGGLYQGPKAVCHLRADGRTYAKDPYTYWGYAWDTGPDITLRSVPAAERRNYICCVCLLRGGKAETLIYNRDVGGSRPRTAIGLKDGALCLYCTDSGRTPEELQAELLALGWESSVMLDGGGSSQCDLAGKRIVSSRKVHNLILVYTRKRAPSEPDDSDKEDKPMSTKYTVCLDPGHGPDTVNGSPDGSYKEREFAWDMYTRIRPLLERHGVNVICTRTEDTKPSLTARCEVSNKAGADLFVSLHSNADGGSGWGTARGLLVYTSSGPMTAKRNVAATAIVNRAHEAGVRLHGSGVAHQIEYTVLAKTDAPAVLIEYGFHTNQEDIGLLKDISYRDKLAEATAMGVCDFLGVTWTAESGGDGTDPPAADRAAEAWQKAKDKGVLDGTRPTDPVTRQELAVVLDRLNLI
jgi:N-acetylmuramoyl-L-alanine amidase|nr:MAG TPA: Cell wall hydrolase autolysin [Caudoviricetes sp.]